MGREGPLLGEVHGGHPLLGLPVCRAVCVGMEEGPKTAPRPWPRGAKTCTEGGHGSVRPVYGFK